jgi:hypothetical protein
MALGADVETINRGATGLVATGYGMDATGQTAVLFESPSRERGKRRLQMADGGADAVGVLPERRRSTGRRSPSMRPSLRRGKISRPSSKWELTRTS